MKEAPPVKILVAGELNPDLIFSGLTAFPEPGREVLAQRLAIQLGSSSAIFAAGMARLDNNVLFVGKIGSDYLGQFSRDQLEQAGVNVSHLIVDPRLTTGTTVSISARDRALMTYLGAISSLSAADVPDELLGQVRHLHVASYYLQSALRSGLPDLFGRARDLGVTISLDPGCDPSGVWSSAEIRDLLPLVDVFLLDEAELAALSAASDVESGLRLLSNGRTLIVAKLGERGCAAFEQGTLRRVPALAVNAIDTTGAGDSFDAGFLHAWLGGMSLQDCLRCGTICGGLSTRGLGGTSSQASWAEVREHWEKLREDSLVTGIQ